MFLDIRNLAGLVATIGVGLLAGILIGTGMAASTARSLPEDAWTMRFQAEDRLFAKAMPPLMLGTLLLLAGVSVLSRGVARVTFGGSLLLMVLVLVVTLGFEVPLNKQIQSWTAGSAPPQWSAVRDLWLERHFVRTIAATLAFISALVARAL
jgi:uncharacterized membrane protein